MTPPKFNHQNRLCHEAETSRRLPRHPHRDHSKNENLMAHISRSPSQETILTPSFIAALEEFLKRRRRSTGPIAISSVHTISPREEKARSSPQAGGSQRAHAFPQPQATPQHTMSHFNAQHQLASTVHGELSYMYV